jgi:hypothetical protein
MRRLARLRIFGEDAVRPSMSHLNLLRPISEHLQVVKGASGFNRLALGVAHIRRPTNDDLKSIISSESLLVLAHPCGNRPGAILHESLGRRIVLSPVDNREQIHQVALPIGAKIAPTNSKRIPGSLDVCSGCFDGIHLERTRFILRVITVCESYDRGMGTGELSFFLCPHSLVPCLLGILHFHKS